MTKISFAYCSFCRNRQCNNSYFETFLFTIPNQLFMICSCMRRKRLIMNCESNSLYPQWRSGMYVCVCVSVCSSPKKMFFCFHPFLLTQCGATGCILEENKRHRWCSFVPVSECLIVIIIIVINYLYIFKNYNYIIILFYHHSIFLIHKNISQFICLEN